MTWENVYNIILCYACNVRENSMDKHLYVYYDLNCVKKVNAVITDDLDINCGIGKL